MDRPPLTLVLTSVLSAAVENTNRPALLATVRDSPRTDDEERAGRGGVVPAPGVIPLPRRASQAPVDDGRTVTGSDLDPTPAA
ncbi:hypothetical protein KIH74_31755 [Kineosporia sp. J2-2]|uniref:Secreted protein n=1 Tax=Kineosporia corallincola TaxID=2835133 RepID=A0ABS5TRY9_9ACTN|nr:hypothetical protein [Kineosporia corallincola]MBT0773564.1 hypothetical protein [Kineosporia corallincola]